MKNLLEGKPLRHPLHPILVHFPIALFVFALILDIGSLVSPDSSWTWRGAFYCIAAGVGMALLASIPGFVDYSDIRNDHPAKKTATYHMLLNLLAVGIYGLNLGLRYSQGFNQPPGWTAVTLSVISIGIISVSGYLGATLIYRDGIAVGRHRRQTPIPEQTIHVKAPEPAPVTTTAPPEDGVQFVPVTDAARLAERSSLRADVDGYIMAIVKFEDRIYAFQDFCTHRFGPLSEGAICDGKVECPWHGSMFDIRTGKVVEGPAKVDLKTYPVEVRDGRIYVGIPRSKREPQEEKPPATTKEKMRRAA